MVDPGFGIQTPNRNSTDQKPWFTVGSFHIFGSFRGCVFSRMRSEGFPFIVWGSGAWTLVRRQCLIGSLISESMGEAAKPLLFEGFQAGCHVVLRGRRGTLWHSNLFHKVSRMSENVKMGGSLARHARFAAPKCLVSSLWFSCGVAVSLGGSCKTSPFRRFPSRLSCRFAWQAWHFVTFQPVS